MNTSFLLSFDRRMLTYEGGMTKIFPDIGMAKVYNRRTNNDTETLTHAHLT